MMRTMRKGFSAAAVFGLATLLLCPLVAGAAGAGNDLATISGRVHDTGGVPGVGALVIVAAASPIIPERSALSGKDRPFSIGNLFSRQYTGKGLMPRFLSP